MLRCILGFFLSFNRGFPLKVVPEGLQVEVYVGPRLGRRLGGLLELSWEGFWEAKMRPKTLQDGAKTGQDRAKTAQDGAKTPPRRPKMGPRRFQDALRCLSDR